MEKIKAYWSGPRATLSTGRTVTVAKSSTGKHYAFVIGNEADDEDCIRFCVGQEAFDVLRDMLNVVGSSHFNAAPGWQPAA